MADVQAAEDRLAALDLQLDSADNDLLLDDDPFAADAEPKGRRKQPAQDDDYGEEDDARLDFEEEQPPQRAPAQRGRANRREEPHASTLTNLGAGLATLQKQRDQRARAARADVDADEDGPLARTQPRAGRRDDSTEIERLGEAERAQEAGFRSKLRAPATGLKQPTASSASSSNAPEAGGKRSALQGLKNQVNSFKERLQSSKTKRPTTNARDALRQGDKKALFGSVVETSGADDSSHFLTKPDRNPRAAAQQPGGAKARGASQAPSLGQKRLEPEFKKGVSSKLLQSRQNRQEQNQRNQGAKRERLGDGVPTFEEVTAKYAENVEQLGEDHEKIIEQILEEEEQLIFKHNTSCKQSIKIVEEEMAILKNVDKPGSDVESYVEQLDKILVRKIEMMVDLRRHCLDFYKNIKTEE